MQCTYSITIIMMKLKFSSNCHLITTAIIFYVFCFSILELRGMGWGGAFVGNMDYKWFRSTHLETFIVECFFSLFLVLSFHIPTDGKCISVS